MKVIFLTTGLAYGGAETQLVRLAIRLRGRRWEVQVFSMLPPQAYVEELLAVGIPVYSLGMRRGVPDPRALLRMAGLLRKHRPQVVTSFMFHANILARLARPLFWVPVLVCSARNVDERGDRGPSRWRDLAYRLTDPLCDLTVQNSKAGLERYARVGAVPRSKIVHIPNGLDLSRFKPRSDVRERVRLVMGLGDEFVWLAVGRLERQKDYATMLHAFAEVVRVRPARLLVAGDGSLRGEVEGLIRQLGLGGQVELLGIRKDIPDLMNAADGFVMSSAWEGLPNVLIEAQACGLPVAATSVGGGPEVVQDGVTGYLVPPKNSGALAQAMLRIMALSSEERRAMGERARAYVREHYELERVVDRWEELYRSFLLQKGIRV